MSTCQRLVTNLNPKPCEAQTVDNDPLCWDCMKKLRETLVGIEGIIEDLEIQRTKQARGARSVGGGSTEVPLPFDLASSEALDQVGAVLQYWYAKNTNRDEHSKLQGLGTEARIRLLIWWHLRNYIATGRRETGPGMFADLDGVLCRAMHSIDRKSNRIWIRDCWECGRPVMAYPKQRDLVDCECGNQIDPQQTRRDLRVIGGQQIVTAAQAEALGEVYGKKIKRANINQWLRRDRIQCQNDPCDGKCNPHRFRFSDILTLLKEN